MATSPTQNRCRPGEVRDAIVASLTAAGGPLSVEEVRAEAALRLGRDIPASSVRSYLNLNTGQGKQFSRVSRGVYKLRRR